MRNDTCLHEEGKNKRPVCHWHNNDKKSRDVAKMVRRRGEVIRAGYLPMLRYLDGLL